MHEERISVVARIEAAKHDGKERSVDVYFTLAEQNNTVSSVAIPTYIEHRHVNL